MTIIYIGTPVVHDEYLRGNAPAHWLYGAVEMETSGNHVIWEEERPNLLNDWHIIRAHKHDAIFIPNLNLHHHLLLLLLSALHIYRNPIYAYLHHAPACKKGLKAKIYKLLLKGVKHLFFLSERTLQETVESGLISRERCSVPGWGPDMQFYKKVETSDSGWFVSTGKENRDFDILIEAFRITGAPLHIITATSHNGANYKDLKKKCEEIPNIKVTILENSPANYPYMVKEMAAAKCLVCPLLRDKLSYCVGLSTIADAEGLGKQLIITDNPYHDNRSSQPGFYRVTDLNSWLQAINALAR